MAPTEMEGLTILDLILDISKHYFNFIFSN